MGGRRRSLRWSLPILIGLSWGAAGRAFAQNDPAMAVQPGPMPAAGPLSGIQDIVVTARKRTGRLQDVPVAITAYTSDQPARYATWSFSQVAALTPDLQVGPQAGVGENVITLRGIGTVSWGKANDRSVALNIGAGGALADREIALDIAVFDDRYKGLQISAFQLEPDKIHGLSLRATVDYDKARFDRFDSSPCYTGQSQAAGCASIVGRDVERNIAITITITPATPATVGNAQNLFGRPLAPAPDWSGNVGATYKREIGDGLTASTASDAGHTGSYFSLPEEDSRSCVNDA